MKEAVEMLVLPIKTLLGHYIYDANRNEILAVSKDLFNYISEVQAGEVCPDSYKSDQEFQLLQSCGYCCDSPLQDVAYPSIDLLKVKLERNLRMITLQLTQSCNFRCDYCIYSENSLYNRTHSHNSMSVSTAKHAIEFFKMHSIDNPNPVVAFYGGEPLLRFSEIKLITQYAEQVFEGKHISFRITTNCSLLSEDMVKFFFDSGHEFYLLISLDGPQQIHDKSRHYANGESSYQAVIDNVHMILDNHPERNKYIHFNAVVDTNNIYKTVSSFINDKDIEACDVQFNYLERNGRIAPYNDKFSSQLNYALFKARIMNERKIEKGNRSDRLASYTLASINQNIKRFAPSNIPTKAIPGGPCEPGVTRLFVTTAGALLPCERVSETTKDMYIGTLDSGFDLGQIEKMINVSKLTSDSCKKCWAFQLCTQCIKSADCKGVISPDYKRTACDNSKRIAFDRLNQKILRFELHRHEVSITTALKRNKR